MNEILRKQFLAHVGQTSPSPMMIEVARSEGVFFYTPTGKRYFDLIAGVSVSNVGHSNPAVVEAVCRQAQSYMHIMVYGEMVEHPQVEYASLLCSRLPDTLQSVYFLNSGSEAVEGAMKIAKRYTGRSQIISFKNAYHGSTQGPLSIMGSPEGEQYKNAFRPLLPDTLSLRFNCTEDLQQITPCTACVIVEPVQGEAGIRPPKPGFLEALRNRCTEVGALLVFDEIQTGFGRCGALFAFQHYGVTPDVICVAKAFGGGMPLGGFITSNEIMSSLTHDPVLGHITTFGGHPVCCAAGLASLKYILENHLDEQSEAKGMLYEQLLTGQPHVTQIRRSGLLIAVELGDSDKMFRMLEMFAECGILSDWFLFCDTAFRISPPLTITDEQIKESCDMIIDCLKKL